MQDQSITPLVEAQETWLPVVGWENWYDVSNLGHVRRIQGRTTGRLLRPAFTALGYPGVVLCTPGRRVYRALHRLVALAFLGPCADGFEVNHKDGNRANPCANNLEYVTHFGNMRHAKDRGSFPNGAAMRRNSKLTIEQVQEIRASTAHPGDLQWHYGVAARQIVRIRRKQAWADID